MYPQEGMYFGVGERIDNSLHIGRFFTRKKRKQTNKKTLSFWVLQTSRTSFFLLLDPKEVVEIRKERKSKSYILNTLYQKNLFKTYKNQTSKENKKLNYGGAGCVL